MTITEFESLEPDRVDAVGSPANGVGFLLLKSAEEPVEKFVSAEDRRKMASEGVAMPNGDFPIPDEDHLRSAVGRLAEYKGDKTAAKRHIIERARALHLTHLLPKDWNVSKDAAKQTAPDKAVPEDEAESQTDTVDVGPEGSVPSPDPGDGGDPRHVGFPHGPSGDGQGDTAPSKDMHEGQAESQTHDDVEGNTAKAEADGRGDVLPDEHVDPSEAEHQTDTDVEGDTRKADADSTPGSPAWEHKDVALGEKAEKLVEELAAVVREFTEREKAEGGHASKAQWRVIRRVRSLIQNPNIIEKEFSDMSASEALKALDEAERARRDMKKAERQAKAEKAAKRDEKAAKAAKKAAKASGSNEVDERIDALRKEIDSLSAKRPFVNGQGVTAVLRGPEATAAFKSFDERVAEAEARLAKAANDYERQAAKTELEAALKSRAGAKLVAADNARERGVLPRGRFGPNSADLFGGTTLTLPDDRAVKGL